MLLLPLAKRNIENLQTLAEIIIKAKILNNFLGHASHFLNVIYLPWN